MADRIIVYPGSIPQDTDLLKTNQNMMTALGFLAQSVLGVGTNLDGLVCVPTNPAGLTVVVGPGSITSYQNLEGSAYGSLAANTASQIVKQGIVRTGTSFACPAPPGSGQSIVYLIQAQFAEQDGGPTVLPYYNAANPAVPYSGPANSGAAQNTVRQGVCVLNLKVGSAATTGSQATPTPDAGYTSLYTITVANGQSAITSLNIVRVAGAPFLDNKMSALAPLNSPAFFGLPTAPTLGLADYSNSLATTAWVKNQFGASFTSPGYQVLANGFIMNWGAATIASGASATITYPLAFPNNYMTGWACPLIDYNASANYSVGFSNYGVNPQTQAVIRNLGASAFGISWFSFGH